MQSTGQTDTHETSNTSMHGSAMTYAMQGLSWRSSAEGVTGSRGTARTIPPRLPRPGREGSPTQPRAQPPGDELGEAPGRDGGVPSGVPPGRTNRTGTTIPFAQ